MRLFFQSIDDTRYTVLDQRRVEVDQQPKPFVGEPQIGQKLLVVNRGENLDRFNLDDHLGFRLAKRVGLALPVIQQEALAQKLDSRG